MTTRADVMGDSVAAAARSAGLEESGVDALRTVYGLSMASRVRQLEDDHHPAYLHPGRSALILLRDASPVDASVLALAMVHESWDVALRPGREEVRLALGDDTLAAIDALPLPGDEDLVERLVGLGPGASLSVLAEQLDQLRHLHLRDDLMDRWAEAHREVGQAWLPFAQRVHPRLATRFAHWYRVFARRI